jgi:hypothetical protein
MQNPVGVRPPSSEKVGEGYFSFDLPAVLSPENENVVKSLVEESIDLFRRLSDRTATSD